MRTIISESKSSERRPSSIHRLWFESLSSTGGQSLRLFCFPYAGGNAHVFRQWQRYCPPEVDLCLVHLPGRGKRIGEPPFTRINLLVHTLADVIVREPQPPYALYGHSMGAIISFELARELRRRGFSAPRSLFLSGRRAPTVPGRELPTFNLPNDAFLAEVRRLNGTPKELLDDPETMQVFLPILRADFEMVDTYQYHPEERLSCPITVYGGMQDTDVPAGSLRAWEEQTHASCKVRMFAGDHFFIHNRGMDFVNAFLRDVLSTLHNSSQEV